MAAAATTRLTVPDPERIRLRHGDLLGVATPAGVAWRGIPYAAAPTGQLRWRAPQPPSRWHGTRSATRYGSVAVQAPEAFDAEEAAGTTGPGPVEQLGSEDCLFINVSAPRTARPAAGWPVLVWIHGGGYVSGSGCALGDGDAFVRAGIVVVTFNYRLGALGFCALRDACDPDGAVAGNCGQLDQRAALSWVGDNIADFGGDPDRVTVYGASAGAKSVAMLMAAPGRLFTRAICSSGGADHVARAPAAAALARRLLDELGCADAAGARRVPAASVLAAQQRILSGVPSTWLWRPSMPPGGEVPTPLQQISGGSATGIALLIGSNGDEAATYAYLMGADRLAATVDAVLEPLFQHRSTSTRSGVRELLDTYRASRPLSETDARLAAMADERYGVPTQRLADAQAVHAPVYRYRIDAAAPGLPPQLDGGHGTEVPMAWQVEQRLPGAARVDAEPWRQRTSALVHAGLINFVRFGVPSDTELAWPGYDVRNRQVMIFDQHPHPESDPRRVERLAWEGIDWQPGSWFGW